ncbi:MAG: T9SS type A sorting domain-containing protein, partial [Ferruginibacter sp.]
ASFAGSVLTFSYPISNNYYTQGFTAVTSIRQFQVIRVPRFYNLTIDPGFFVTAPTWNGSTGGVIVLDAANTFTLNGTVLATALGFRGGGGKNFTGAGIGNTNGATSLVNTDYRWNSSTTSPGNETGGAKGEGIAGTPIYILQKGAGTTTINAVEGYINGSIGRSSAGNGGGGATDGAPVGAGNNQYNTGGGGGSNGGFGGLGGSGWHGGSGTAATYPYGGYGAAAFSQNSFNRFILGGGGGAGTANNSSAANEYQSSGGCGGGIIIMRAKLYAGTGNIVADGGDAPGVVGVGGTTNTDAAGGGGAGGTIVAITRATGATGLGSITASAIGGKGGDMTNYYDHGPGGGGGGGIIYTNGTFTSTNVLAGTNGKTRTGSTAGPITNDFGATPGGNGQVVTTAAAPMLINSNNLSIPCGVLPVTLTNFYAVAKPGLVTLFWEVEKALNFHYFEIEYSTDGISFMAAGKINYDINTSKYQFLHNVNGLPVIYYRLKMFDISGSYVYSKIIVVRTGNDKISALLFPNPASTGTTLELTGNTTTNAFITVIDETGRTVIKNSITINSGSNFYSIDCKNLPAGIYLLKVNNTNEQLFRQQLIVSGRK